MKKQKEIKQVGLKGVTDLFSKYPYTEDGIFNPIIDISEEDFKKTPSIYYSYIDYENEKYINYLKEIGEFEKEYDLNLVIEDNIIDRIYNK